MAKRLRFKFGVGQRVKHIGALAWFRVTSRSNNHGGTGHNRYWGEYQPRVGGAVGAYEDELVAVPAKARHSRHKTLRRTRQRLSPYKEIGLPKDFVMTGKWTPSGKLRRVAAPGRPR